MAKTAALPDPKSASAVSEVPSPPLAPSSAPLCFVVDEESSIRHFVSLVLHGYGIDSMEFPDGASMRTAIDKRTPDLIFHNVSLDSADAVGSMVALGAAHYRGAVQLMSARGAAVLEHVKSVGLQHKLNILPVLKKPFETDAIITVTRDLKLGMPPAVATRLELDEALASNWIEFWYQPKIELRKKRLAGAEAYARARHPQHGIVLPSAFMPGAQEPALVKLGEHALNSALTTAARFSELGVHLKLTVNIPLNALAKLPVADIVKAHQPGPKWPGWCALTMSATGNLASALRGTLTVSLRWTPSSEKRAAVVSALLSACSPSLTRAGSCAPGMKALGSTMPCCGWRARA